MYGTDAMMSFRTSYLQAISKAWRDESYLKKLKKNPKGELEKLGFDYVWEIDLAIISVSSQESLWDPENTGGWVGRNPLISIWIPPTPELPEDYGIAWAKYYEEFPSFLGEKKPQQGVNEAFQLGMGQWKDFLEFGGVLMRLIALAWKDEQAKNELMDIKDTPEGRLVLNKWLGYNIPWNMDIEFKLSGWFDDSPKDEKKCRWDHAGKSWPKPVDKGSERPKSCRNALNFYIPNKPSDDPSIDAIALSAYNVTGDQYPFTCP